MKNVIKKMTKRVFAGILALAAVLSVMAFSPSTAEAAQDFSGTYYIQTALGNRVLDIAGASRSNGGNLQIYTANNSKAQQFKVIKSGNYYRIQNANSGLVLDVAGGSKANKANVRQWKWNGSKAQLWSFVSAGNGQYYIKNVGSGKMLDVAGGKNQNKANVWQYAGNKSKAQKWSLKKAVSQNTTTNVYLDTTNNTVPNYNSVDVRPRKVWYENGRVMAECYVINGTYRTVSNIRVNSLTLMAKNGMLASGYFGELQGLTIGARQYKVWTFCFSADAVYSRNLDLRDFMAYTSMTSWR